MYVQKQVLHSFSSEVVKISFLCVKKSSLSCCWVSFKLLGVWRSSYGGSKVCRASYL